MLSKESISNLLCLLLVLSLLMRTGGNDWTYRVLYRFFSMMYVICAANEFTLLYCETINMPEIIKNIPDCQNWQLRVQVETISRRRKQ